MNLMAEMSLEKSISSEYLASLETLREGWARAEMSEPEDLPGGPQGSCGVQ